MPDGQYSSKQFYFLLITLLFLSALILATEPLTGLGLAHSLFYVPVMMFAVGTQNHKIILTILIVAVSGTWLGTLLSPLPPAGIALDYAIGNRILTTISIIAVYVIGYFSLTVKKRLEFEKQIAISEKNNFSQLAESLPVQIWTATAEGAIDYVGDKLVVFCGRDKNTIQKTWLELLHPDDREPTVKAWQHSVNTGAPYGVEFRLKRHDDVYVWHLTSATPSRNEHGQITKWFGSSVDISTLKALDERASLLSTQLYNTLECINDAFITVDKDFQITFANQKACNILHVTQSDVALAPLWDHFSENNDKPITNKIIEAVSSKSAVQLSAWFTGGQCWLEMQIYPSNDGGIAIYFRDITAEKKRQEELKLLQAAVARINDIILITEAEPLDLPGPRIVYANKAYERKTGYKLEEIIGNTPRILQGPKTDRKELDKIKAALKKWQPIRTELINYTKRREEIHLEIEILPIADESGYFTHWVSVERDVTEQRKFQSQMENSQRMESIGRLTGGIAHDFNNLLTVVLGNADMLSMFAKDPNMVKSSAGMIIKAAEKASALTKSLLAFSRKQALLPQIIDLKTLFAELDPLLQSSVSEKNKLHIEIEDNAWPVEVDPAQLESALLNMAINSRDAMPKGGLFSIEVKNIHLYEQDLPSLEEMIPGDYVMFVISDNGAGMSREQQSKIYEPFYTTKSPDKGTGLGLSMVFGFVKQSGGHIQVYSEPDFGTTFRIYFPKAEATIAQKPENVLMEEIQFKGTGQKILIVEDNPSILSLAEQYLKQAGYQTLTASDADEALKIIEKADDLDMLFTDIIMPGSVSGLGVASAFEAKFKAQPILLSSGFAEVLLREDKRIHQDKPFLTKPYRQKEFLLEIGKCLNKVTKMPD